MNQFIIIYPELGVVQKKTLIPHSEFLYAKELLNIEMARTDIPKKQRDEDIMKKYLKKYGNYFTDNSPLFYSITTGILKCNNQEFKIIIHPI